MKKILALMLLVASSVCYAQKTEFWTADKIECGDYVKPIKEGGIFIYTSTRKMATVDKNSKEIDGYSFSQRLKFRGTGTAAGCCILVNVKKNDVVTIYGMSGNSHDGNQTMIVKKAQSNDVIAPDFLINDGTKIGKGVYVHQGDEDNVVFLCTTHTFNIYGIKIERAN